MDSDTTPLFMPYLAQRFQALVWACIDSDLTRTAVFYAERYFIMDRNSHDALHLYSTALLRDGQVYTALSQVNIPKDSQCSGCLEIKARCASQLGRYRQAKEALDLSLRDTSYSPNGTRRSRTYPEEAFLHCRSGTLALKGNLPEQSAASFKQALVINPLLWEAFEGLCTLGNVPDIDQLFPPRAAPMKSLLPEEHLAKGGVPLPAGASFLSPNSIGNSTLNRTGKSEASQPFRVGTSVPPAATSDARFPTDMFFQPLHRPTRSQPAGTTSIHHTVSRPLSSADEAGPVQKKLRSTGKLPETKLGKSSKASLDDPHKKASSFSRTTIAAKNNNSIAGPSSGTRRSTRLLSGSGSKISKTSTRERRRPTVHGRSKSTESEMDEDVEGYSPSSPGAARSDRSPSPVNGFLTQERTNQEIYEFEQADHYMYDLMRRFAIATRALTLFESQKCLNEIASLPIVHQKSPWVVAMSAKAYYSKLDYASADRAFSALREIEPTRLWDMEIFSTLLWHLQRPVELSYLAQELININPRSPQAWIAVGNLFSLQKERPQALTCFRRATQMDPSCAYAYTLSGHECIDEDVDKATHFFQSALRVDPRHFNAWYGLGTCYMRQSKIRLAEYHYRKALEIHPHNAVLLGCVGMAVERRGDVTEALNLFNEAVRVSPDNALVRYRRAKILIGQKKYEAAIKDLEILRDLTPEESNVIFQLAKVYRLVGDEYKSAQLLAVARDMAPKSLNKIKKLLDTMKDETVDDRMDEG